MRAQFGVDPCMLTPRYVTPYKETRRQACFIFFLASHTCNCLYVRPTSAKGTRLMCVPHPLLVDMDVLHAYQGVNACKDGMCAAPWGLAITQSCNALSLHHVDPSHHSCSASSAVIPSNTLCGKLYGKRLPHDWQMCTRGIPTWDWIGFVFRACYCVTKT